MTLAIKTETVVEVLLDDGWHKLLERSFSLDAYEFTQAGRRILGSGGDKTVSLTGFVFTTESGDVLCGPLNAVRAVRLRGHRGR